MQLVLGGALCVGGWGEQLPAVPRGSDICFAGQQLVSAVLARELFVKPWTGFVLGVPRWDVLL